MTSLLSIPYMKTVTYGLKILSNKFWTNNEVAKLEM